MQGNLSSIIADEVVVLLCCSTTRVMQPWRGEKRWDNDTSYDGEFCALASDYVTLYQLCLDWVPQFHYAKCEAQFLPPPHPPKKKHEKIHTQSRNAVQEIGTAVQWIKKWVLFWLIRLRKTATGATIVTWPQTYIHTRLAIRYFSCSHRGICFPRKDWLQGRKRGAVYTAR